MPTTINQQLDDIRAQLARPAAMHKAACESLDAVQAMAAKDGTDV